MQPCRRSSSGCKSTKSSAPLHCSSLPSRKPSRCATTRCVDAFVSINHKALQPYSEEAWQTCLHRVSSTHAPLRRCAVDDLDRMEREAVTLRQRITAKVEARKEQAGGSLEALEQEIGDLQAQEEAMRAETRAASRTVKKLQRGYNVRWNTFLQTRKEMAQNVSHCFGTCVGDDVPVCLTALHSIMGRRGWAGEVEVDYDEKRLIIRVTTSDGRMVPDLKSLSGGERSYTTLSFVLALGQANASPFHVFDEYDVFMDQNVRVVATRELLRHARRMSSTQFILLSPQVCRRNVCVTLRHPKATGPDRGVHGKGRRGTQGARRGL